MLCIVNHWDFLKVVVVVFVAVELVEHYCIQVALVDWLVLNMVVCLSMVLDLVVEVDLAVLLHHRHVMIF